MNLVEFSSLDGDKKIDYVVKLLTEAKNIFKDIHDNCRLGIEEKTVDELNRIGDKLVEYAEMTEMGFADVVFEGLNKELVILRELLGNIGGSLIN